MWVATGGSTWHLCDMNPWIWGLVAVAAVLAWLFNRVVALRQRARGAWSDIDVQLKRRWDLIPSLTGAVKGAMSFERETLEAVVSARSRAQALESASPATRGREESSLAAATHNLIALVEKYPDLKAGTNVSELQKSLVEIEDALQSARRYYNAVVRDYNTLIATVPTVLLAAVLRFPKLEFFQADDEDRAVPAVDLRT